MFRLFGKLLLSITAIYYHNAVLAVPTPNISFSDAKPITLVNEVSCRLNSLFDRYGRERVYVALFFCDNTIFGEFAKTQENVNYCSLGANIDSYLTDAPCDLENILTDDCIEFAKKWCELENQILSITPMKSDTDISTFEILYRMADSKRHFQDFLSHESQYYGSLSFEQECKIFYNLLLYLTQSEHAVVKSFFCEYRNVNEILQRRNDDRSE
jgi:hypothetical protein